MTDDAHLNEGDVDLDAYQQFVRWLNEAIAAGELAPHAMALATTDASGRPSVRMVQLAEVDARGFTFETNVDSPKAVDLRANPRAALVFHWPRLVRQVRVAGTVVELSRDDAQRLYAVHPEDVRAMLWACRQSAVVASRDELERAFFLALAEGDTVPPAHWGAYRLRAETIEFWQGRAHWLQDRLLYTRTATDWRIDRLAP